MSHAAESGSLSMDLEATGGFARGFVGSLHSRSRGISEFEFQSHLLWLQSCGESGGRRLDSEHPGR